MIRTTRSLPFPSSSFSSLPSASSLPFAVLAMLAMPPCLVAQWSPNPAQNFAIADLAGEQALPRIATTSDGGCYVAWFDHSGAQYDVRLQRLDAAGVEQWPHDGIVVSSNPQSSSLVDWDMLCDSEDHCVLTFTDVRAGGDLDVYAYRIAPAGTFDWGAQGVTLSNNADYEPNPRVCEASDGDFVFVWSNTVQHTIQLQRLDRSGTPRFPGDGIAIPGDSGASPGFARVVAADAGSVIVQWVRTTAFSGNKHVHAQKFDAAGNGLWNNGVRIAVFDGGSVPIAHEPRLLPDGQGGAISSWHFATGNQFSVRVQHLLANGSEAFVHDGVDAAVTTDSLFDPAVTWDAASNAVVVCWNQRNTAQTTWGLFAQRIDAAGNRSWGNAGVTLLPITTTTLFAPVAVPFAGGAIVAVLEQSLGGQAKKVLALRVDAAGNRLWVPPVDACTVASEKLRLQAAITPSGVALLAWGDARADSGDIVAQNVDALGRLGNHLAVATEYGCRVNPSGSLVSSGRPSLGGTFVVGVDNPLGSQAAGALPLLVLAVAAAPGYPCGTPTAGFGMAPGGVGELLVDTAQPHAVRIGGPWAGPQQPVTFPVGVPLATSLAGLTFFAQGALVDLAPGATLPIGVTTGLRLDLGF